MSYIKFVHLYKDWGRSYLSGMSIENIAKNYGCSNNAVRDALIKIGVEIRGQHRRVRLARDEFERFVIRRKEGCWGWSGRITSKGYAEFSAERKVFFGHRYSYSIYKTDPGILFVCHSCDNTACTNPDHLFLGTQSKNMIDCQMKNRSNKNKLKQEDVIRIVNLFNDGIPNYDLAKSYNVNISTINNILGGRTWSYITNLKRKHK